MKGSIVVQFLFLLLLATISTTFQFQIAASGADDETGPELQRPSVIVIPTKGYKPPPESAASKEGERKFGYLNCMACHSVHNAGGTLGPPLDGVGANRTKEYLLARIVDSKKERQEFAQLIGGDPRFIPPHTRLSEPTANLIVEYLLTLPEPNGGFVVVPHVPRMAAETPQANLEYKPLPTSQNSKLGSQLYSKSGCVACHSIGKVGGWIAPNLDGVGGRHAREWIVAHINNPSVHAGPQDEGALPEQMPSASISKKDVQRIADYLLTLPNLAAP